MKITLLTRSCCHLPVGVSPGTAAPTRANALMGRLGLAAVFDPSSGARMTQRGFPWGWLCPRSTTLTQNQPRVFLSSLLLQMCSALLMAQASCAESCPKLQASLVLGEGTHCPASHCLWSSSCGQTPLSSHLTGLLSRVSCQSPAGAYGCNIERARGCGKHHLVLICVLLSAC